MTSAAVSDISQTSSFLSDVKSGLPLQADGGAGSGSVAAGASVGNLVNSFDTVSISSRSRRAVVGEMEKGVTPEAAQKEKVKKEEANIRLKSESSGQAPAKVEFVYNQRGELIVKYMDASDRLVYQVPSELMLLQKETAAKSLSVDENV